MAQPYYETFQNIGNSGINVAFYTTPGGYRPLHWHEELEILYPLNGLSEITVEGTKYSLPKKQLMAVESMQVHSTFCYDQTSMFLCIHIARKHFQDCMPDIEDHHILCRPDLISVEKFPAYLEICQLLENMTRLYIQDATAFYLEAEGLTLQVLARLIRVFSTSVLPPDKKGDRLTANRLRDIISYVEEHYQEPVTLQDAADLAGLGKEAFCRFFKNIFHMTPVEYINHYRISQSIKMLQSGRRSILEICLDCGFESPSYFVKLFKKETGFTPAEYRKRFH